MAFYSVRGRAAVQAAAGADRAIATLWNPSSRQGYFGLSLGTSSVAETSGMLHASRFRNDIESAWESRSALTHQAGDVPGAVYGGKFYVFGGYGTGDTDFLNYTQIYDPSTNSWSQGATMPTARWGAAAAAYNGKIYVFGGTASGGATNKCEIYDITGDSWITGTNLPTAIANGLMAVTVGSKIYIFYYNLVYEFDPAANGGLGSYTTKTAPPSAAQKKWATCAYVNVSGEDRIYLIGGSNSSDAYLDNNYYYRPTNNDWSSAQAAAPYTAHGVTRDNPVYNGKIYYALGWRGSTRFYSKIYRYDPSTNSWSGNLGASPSRGKDGVACGVINDVLYVAGGRDVGTSPYGLTECEAFLINKSVSLTYTMTKLELYFPTSGASGNVRLGIYADDACLPGALLLDAGAVAIAQGWVVISGLSLDIGLDYYWLAFDMSANNDIRYVSSMPLDSHVWLTRAYDALPNPFGTPEGGETTKFVARAYVVSPVTVPKRLRVIEWGLVITGTAPASSNFAVRRISGAANKGTPGSTVSPAIQQSFQRDIAPISALLDLASYSVQPTFESGYLHMAWQNPTIVAAGLITPVPRGIEIPSDAGLSLATIDATNAFPACEVWFTWEE